MAETVRPSDSADESRPSLPSPAPEGTGNAPTEPLPSDEATPLVPVPAKPPTEIGQGRRGFLSGVAMVALGAAAAASSGASVKSKILSRIAREVAQAGGGGAPTYVKGGYSKGNYSKADQYTKNGVDHYSKGTPGRNHYSKAPGDETYTKHTYSKYSKIGPPVYVKATEIEPIEP